MILHQLIILLTLFNNLDQPLLKHHLHLVLLFALSFCLESHGQNNDDLTAAQRLDTKILLAYDIIEENPEQAIGILLEAKELALSINDTFSLARITNNLGTAHYYLSDDVSALELWREALKLGTAVKRNDFLLSVYNNLGNGYTLVDPDSSIYFYRKSIAGYHAAGQPLEVGDMLGNISFTYYDDLQNHDSAYVYAWKAIEVYEQVKDTMGIFSMWAQLGRIMVEIGHPDSSLYWGKKGLNMARATASSRIEEPALDALRLTYAELGKFEMAYLYSDSLINHILDQNEVERLALVTEIEGAHEMALKELEIENLELKANSQRKEINRQNIVIGSSVIGLALLLFLGYRMMKEKRRSDDLLLNILPVKIAEELKSTGRAKARRYDSVSVIFTDFKDFSKLSDEIGPEELVEMIDEYYSAFDRIIETYGLEKIKTIGDSYMAAGGLPEPTNGHAEKAVQAALEMHTHMKILNAKKKKEGKRTFETRIGVHTGPVVAGVVGIKKFAYDIWGDTVNTANRLEKAGEPGKVNISANTYELVKHSFDCTHRGKIAIKNMGEIDMYFVG